MEERKETKIKVNSIIAVICTFIIIMTGIYLCYLNNYTYYGEYQLAGFYKGDIGIGINKINKDDTYKIVSNYSEYSNILNEAKEIGWKNIEYKYNSSFFNNNSLIFVELLGIGSADTKTRLISVKEQNDIVNIEMYFNHPGITGDATGNLYFIAVSKNVKDANITYKTESCYLIPNIIGAVIIFIFTLILLIILCLKVKTKKTKEKIIVVVGICISIILIYYITLYLIATLPSPTYYI